MDCAVCGVSPCYLICPTQDPYQGDQQAENDDYEAFAQSDYISEAYGATARDADAFFMDDEDPTHWVSEARFDSHVENCVRTLLWGLWVAQAGSDEIPF
jgi:hypothetical protein